MSHSQFLSKTQIFPKGGKKDILASTKIRENQEWETQTKQKFNRQSQESNNLKDKNQPTARNSVKQALIQENNNEIIKEIGDLAKQLLINSQLKNKKNIIIDQEPTEQAAQQWNISIKNYQESTKYEEKTKKLDRKLNFNCSNKDNQIDMPKQPQPDDFSTNQSNVEKIQISKRDSKHFSYKIKVFQIDMVQKLSIVLSHSFQAQGQCKLVKLKALLASSIEARFPQYNKPYFIKFLNLNPEIVYEGLNQYTLTGSLQLRVLKLSQGHHHIPQKFQQFQVKDLIIWNEYGSIAWQDVDLREIDAGKNIKIGDNVIHCANQSLNRQCIVTFNTLPLNLQPLRRSPQLFEANLRELLVQQDNCELIAFDLSKGTWKILIKCFPQ